MDFLTKERCHAKFLEGHLTELGLLIGPNKSGSFVKEVVENTLFPRNGLKERKNLRQISLLK